MSKESVYDEQINPLVIEILELCRVHKIAVVMDFRLGGTLHCSSALLAPEYDPSESQLLAWESLTPYPSL